MSENKNNCLVLVVYLRGLEKPLKFIVTGTQEAHPELDTALTEIKDACGLVSLPIINGLPAAIHESEIVALYVKVGLSLDDSDVIGMTQETFDGLFETQLKPMADMLSKLKSRTGRSKPPEDLDFTDPGWLKR